MQTLTNHILQKQRKTRQLTSGFHILLTQIEVTTKIIASHVKASGLVDILGKTGDTNSFGEEIQKLDAYADKLLIDTLLKSGQVYALVSEEHRDPIYPEKEDQGDYIVYFDPLDGSSNINTNAAIGTIFSIYHKDGGLLQAGKKQIAAGYAIYGSSVMFVYTISDGVNGFTLDPSMGSYLLSHPYMQIAQASPIISVNEAYASIFPKQVNAYINHAKKKPKASCRYIGSLVADAHRTFIKGGVFMYPVTKKRPDGKLRLMLEVNPFALLTQQANGSVVGKSTENPLDIVPSHIHDRYPIIMGSRDNIGDYVSMLQD